MNREPQRGSPIAGDEATSGSGGVGARPPGDPAPRYNLPGAPEGLGTLISGTVKDLQDLVRAEVRLAKTELTAEAKSLGSAAGMMAAGAFVGLVGAIYLVFAAVHLLDKALEELWLSAGIVSLVLLAVAAILAQRGRRKMQETGLKPEQTMQTLEEDQEWAKQQINSVKR